MNSTSPLILERPCQRPERLRERNLNNREREDGLPILQTLVLVKRYMRRWTVQRLKLWLLNTDSADCKVLVVDHPAFPLPGNTPRRSVHIALSDTATTSKTSSPPRRFPLAGLLPIPASPPHRRRPPSLSFFTVVPTGRRSRCRGTDGAEVEGRAKKQGGTRARRRGPPERCGHMREAARASSGGGMDELDSRVTDDLFFGQIAPMRHR